MGLSLKSYDELIDWLLEGDVSIQYQVHKFLLGKERSDLQGRILKEGWGRGFLLARNEDGTWGQKYYQPKWISTHYTLLDIRHLMCSMDNEIQSLINQLSEKEKGPDGGILPIGTSQASDVCVNGMFLNFASYFHADEEGLRSVVDFLITEWMEDGGFNCRSNRSGATHSSMHSTISVLEGIDAYLSRDYTYKRKELERCKSKSEEFLLMHHLYKSDRTGEIISREFLRLCHPSRWKYNVLRAMDYFALSKSSWDGRMEDALKSILEKRRKDGTLPVNAHHPGKTHFQMERAGQASRWNTLKLLRILKHFDRLDLLNH